MSNPTPFPSAVDGAALGVTTFAILLEAISDCQLDAHIAARREKRTDATVLSSGLWAWSRHPNYLGEMSWWWGVWLLGCESSSTWPALAGPLAITFLFAGISVKLMEDRQIANKGDLYREYQREVPSPLLLLPPPIGRWLGKTLSGSGAQMN